MAYKTEYQRDSGLLIYQERKSTIESSIMTHPAHRHRLALGLSLKKLTAMVGLSVVCCAGVGMLIRGSTAQGNSDSRSETLDENAEAQLASTPLCASSPSLDGLCREIQEEDKSIDVLALNLAIAREIPSLRSLDVSKYQRVLDSWADHVRREVQRNLHRFRAAPKDFNNSQAYFTAMMLCTVVGQDFQVRYDQSGFSFEKPEDLFVHGVIDNRRGTCISLPVLYVALGQRLGYPIKAVAVPGHTFCRWDDPTTGERFNMEVSNQGGFTDHPDEYYRHWPFELDPRWEREHHVLTTLTTLQYASVMVGALASYFEATKDVPSAVRYDALAHWLDPGNRSAVVSLRLNMERNYARYFDADELAGKKQYWTLKPHPTIQSQIRNEKKTTSEAVRSSSPTQKDK